MKKIFRTFILIGVLCLCRCAARSFKSRGRGFSILHAANIFQHGNDFERAIEHDSVRISGHHVLDPDLSCNNNNENPHEMKKHEEATNETQLAALMKLGWDEEECRSALEKSEGDVTKAVEILEDKDEYKDQLDETASNISITYGWNIEAARIALDECQLNVEDALQRLNEEEENIKSSFEVNVSDMVQSGWDEFIARQALLAQWDLDQRKARGINSSLDRGFLDTIRPTLKNPEKLPQNKSSESEQRIQQPLTKSPPSEYHEDFSNSNHEEKMDQKIVEKADVIFDVTAKEFRKIVLESPVPVLLDVYADWCGPCKQLGPLLEDITMKAEGKFRLVKLNSDKERQLVDCLNVKGLPTVYALSQGKITDRFVGMIDAKDMQSFIIRAVTGMGKPYALQKENLSALDFNQMTTKIANLAGLHSISFKKKQRIWDLTEEALNLPHAFDVDSVGKVRPNASIKTALLYIKNAAENIHNPKVLNISKNNKIFSTVISSSTSAIKLLEVAGFQDDNDGKLKLVHKNSAILNVVLQKAGEIIDAKRFSKMSSAPPVSPQTSLEARSVSPPETHQAYEQLAQEEKVTVSFRGRLVENGAIIQKSSTLSRNATLAKAMELLPLSLDDFPGFQLIKNYPLPTNAVSSNELNCRLSDFDDGTCSIILTTKPFECVPAVSLNDRTQETKKIVKKRPIKGKFNTLASLGILSGNDKRHNEYFGGDSTVVSSGEEEDSSQQS